MPFLQARLEGEAIGAGRIPVSHLLFLLKDLNKAFCRSALVLAGEADSVRRGAQPRSIKDEISLDLVLLTHGSQAAVLGFERRQAQQSLAGRGMGREVFEKSLAGLSEIQRKGDALPIGFDSGVLLAWRDVGLLFHKGVEEIRFTLNGDRQRVPGTPYLIGGNCARTKLSFMDIVKCSVLGTGSCQKSSPEFTGPCRSWTSPPAPPLTKGKEGGFLHSRPGNQRPNIGHFCWQWV